MKLMDGQGRREAIRRLLGGRLDGLGELCLDLEVDGTWSVVVRRTPVQVRCVLGLAVITCEGDAEDHVLPDGASFVARQPGRLAIWALEPAHLRVSAAGEKAPGRWTDRARIQAGERSP